MTIAATPTTSDDSDSNSDSESSSDSDNEEREHDNSSTSHAALPVTHRHHSEASKAATLSTWTMYGSTAAAKQHGSLSHEFDP
jgi:hypothetical protein